MKTDGIKIAGVPRKWQNGAIYRHGDTTIKMVSGSKLHVMVGKGIAFEILRHTMNNQQKMVTPYLGFYMLATRGLSSHTKGLLGM